MSLVYYTLQLTMVRSKRSNWFYSPNRRNRTTTKKNETIISYDVFELFDLKIVWFYPTAKIHNYNFVISQRIDVFSEVSSSDTIIKQRGSK